MVAGRQFADDPSAIVVYGDVSGTALASRKPVVLTISDEEDASTATVSVRRQLTPVSKTATRSHQVVAVVPAKRPTGVSMTRDRNTTTNGDVEKGNPSPAGGYVFRLEAEDRSVPLVPIGAPFGAYSSMVHAPSAPPLFANWTEFYHMLENLVYRSTGWEDLHGMFLSASEAGKALGVHPDVTPEKAKYERISKSPASRYLLYIMERGYLLEFLHVALLRLLMYGKGKKCELETCDRSGIHPTERWIMATPDGRVRRRSDGGLVRLVEFKTRTTNAHREISPEHMAQIQVAMQVADATECDLSSLYVDDQTLESEWVVIRAVRSDEYWKRAVPVLRSFVRSVLSEYGRHPTDPVRDPPRRGPFVVPEILTEMVVSMRNVLDLVPGSRERVVAALREANRCAEERFARQSQRHESKDVASLLAGLKC